MENSPNPQDVVVGAAGYMVKMLALVDIYAFAGHPYVYFDLWRKGMWYFWVPLGLIAPLALFWAVSVLTWRVRVDRRKIRIVSVSGLMERPIAEVARVELRKGNLAIEFANGEEKVIPMFVGNLNTLCAHIEQLRREQQ